MNMHTHTPPLALLVCLSGLAREGEGGREGGKGERLILCVCVCVCWGERKERVSMCRCVCSECEGLFFMATRVGLVCGVREGGRECVCVCVAGGVQGGRKGGEGGWAGVHSHVLTSSG